MHKPGLFVYFTLLNLVLFFLFLKNSRYVRLDSGLITVTWQTLFQYTEVSRDWAFLTGEGILVNAVPFTCAIEVFLLSEAV